LSLPLFDFGAQLFYNLVFCRLTYDLAPALLCASSGSVTY